MNHRQPAKREGLRRGAGLLDRRGDNPACRTHRPWPTPGREEPGSGVPHLRHGHGQCQAALQVAAGAHGNRVEMTRQEQRRPVGLRRSAQQPDEPQQSDELQLALVLEPGELAASQTQPQQYNNTGQSNPRAHEPPTLAQSRGFLVPASRVDTRTRRAVPVSIFRSLKLFHQRRLPVADYAEWNGQQSNDSFGAAGTTIDSYVVLPRQREDANCNCDAIPAIVPDLWGNVRTERLSVACRSRQAAGRIKNGNEDGHCQATESKKRAAKRRMLSQKRGGDEEFREGCNKIHCLR